MLLTSWSLLICLTKLFIVFCYYFISNFSISVFLPVYALLSLLLTSVSIILLLAHYCHFELICVNMFLSLLFIHYPQLCFPAMTAYLWYECYKYAYKCLILSSLLVTLYVCLNNNDHNFCTFILSVVFLGCIVFKLPLSLYIVIVHICYLYE